MSSERTHELTQQLKQRIAEYAAIEDRSQLASNPPGDIIEALGEWESLLSERSLTSVRENPSDPGEVDSLVGARLKPKRPLNSGLIALPLPNTPDLEASSIPPHEMHLTAAV